MHMSQILENQCEIRRDVNTGALVLVVVEFMVSFSWIWA